MRYFSNTRVWSLTLTAALAGFLAGCASEGAYSSNAVESLEETRSDVVDKRIEVQTMLSSVQALGSTDTALRANYNQLVANIDNVEDDMHAMRNLSRDLNQRAADYRWAWQTDGAAVDNQQLRESREGESEVAQQYEQVSTEARQAYQAYEPFLRDLRDIRTYLDRDLTPQGIESADDALQQAQENGQAVLERLDSLIRSMDQLASRLSPMGLESTSAERSRR